MSGVNISICDGKYTVIQAPTGTTRAFAIEEWRDVTGDNVIGGLAWELQEARDRIKRLEEDLMNAKNRYASLIWLTLRSTRTGIERIKQLEERSDVMRADLRAMKRLVEEEKRNVSTASPLNQLSMAEAGMD